MSIAARESATARSIATARPRTATAGSSHRVTPPVSNQLANDPPSATLTSSASAALHCRPCLPQPIEPIPARAAERDRDRVGGVRRATVVAQAQQQSNHARHFLLVGAPVAGDRRLHL